MTSKAKKTVAIVWALGIAVVIILLLGAVATPKFIGFACKSKQSEAKTNLAGIFTAQASFFEENGHYAPDTDTLNWQPDGTPVYEYSLVNPADAVEADASAEPPAFVARATANIDRDETLDTWTINQERDMVNETNDCSR